jgi:hypothetical protein
MAFRRRKKIGNRGADVKLQLTQSNTLTEKQNSAIETAT